MLCVMNSLEENPISIHRTIANYYWLDAMDFLSRFNELWERETHKTGRIKTFVDLLMACECALKSHAMLGAEGVRPEKIYQNIRKASHRIDKLADLACLNADRSKYEFVKKKLHDFSVFIRYSLEAYDVFFPILESWDEAEINYSKTIGNNDWVMSVRECIQTLVDELNPHFTGAVTMDIERVFSHAEEMKAFISKARQ